MYNKETGNVAKKEVYSYNDKGQQTGTEKISYRKDGSPAKSEKYNANQELVTKSTYSTDENGTQVKKDYSITGDYKGSTTTTYDRYGQVENETKTNAKGKVVSTKTHEYYDSGVESSSTKKTGKGDVISQKTYNETGVITNDKSYAKNSNGEYCLTESKFDENGNKTSETKFSSQNKPLLTTNYKNDEKGNPVSAELLNGSGEKFGDIKYSYDKNGNVTEIKTDYTNGTSQSQQYTYNDNNQITSSTRTNSKGQTEIVTNVYDDNGNLVQKATKGFDGLTTQTNYKRNSSNQITEKTEIDKNGNITKEEYTYNLLNNNVKSIKTTNPDGTVTNKEYGFYPSGARKFEIESDGTKDSKYKISLYDKNGNLVEEPSTVTADKVTSVLSKLNPQTKVKNDTNDNNVSQSTQKSAGAPSVKNSGAAYDEKTGTYKITVETYRDGKVQDDGNGGKRYPNGSFWGIVTNVYPNLSESSKSTVYQIISQMNNGKTSLYTGDSLNLPILQYDSNGKITGYKTSENGKTYPFTASNSSGTTTKPTTSPSSSSSSTQSSTQPQKPNTSSSTAGSYNSSSSALSSTSGQTTTSATNTGYSALNPWENNRNRVNDVTDTISGNIQGASDVYRTGSDILGAVSDAYGDAADKAHDNGDHLSGFALNAAETVTGIQEEILDGAADILDEINDNLQDWSDDFNTGSEQLADWWEAGWNQIKGWFSKK